MAEPVALNAVSLHASNAELPMFGDLCRTCSILVCLFSLGSLVGCDRRQASREDSSSAKNTSSAAGTQSNNDPPAGTQILGVLPPFEFVDQNRQRFGLDDLRGNVAIVNFIFTACPGTCPIQSEWMSKISQRLADQPTRQGIRLLSITVDPENDTPDVLKDYAARYHADPALWKFLTGDKKQIWELSREGFKFPVELNPNDPLIPIAHDSKFALVDRLGRVRGYFDLIGDNGIERLWRALDHVLPEFAPDVARWPRLQGQPLTHLAQPPEILSTEWLDELKQQEAERLTGSTVKHDFEFTDVVDESGITFFPQIVDDQRWRLLVNHYDHGNSICVADVDGDGLLDLYFVSQVGPNELWRNLGQGKFENITQAAGVGVAEHISVAASLADIDNDGDADLFVSTIRSGNFLFENDGTGTFHDITETAGVGAAGHSSTGTFFDYDNDGRLDLFVANVGEFTTEEYAAVRRDLCNSQPETDVSYYVGRADAFAGHLREELGEQSRLYRNLGENRFEDVTEQTGLNDRSWSGDAIPIDVNHDGWLDLYVLSMQGDDHLYVNLQGEKFEDQTQQYFPRTPWGAMGAKVFDYNGDGEFDLFLTDMHSDMSEDIGPDREKLKSRMQWPADFLETQQSIFGNALFQRLPDGSYREVSDQTNTENYWPWGLSAGDLNADGTPDLFIASSMCFPYRYGMNSLLLNTGSDGFVDAQFTLGIEPRAAGKMLAPWFSLDCAGLDQEHPMCRQRSGNVVVWSARGTRSSVMFDYDADGDLDIVTNEFNTPPQVLRSNLAETSNVHYVQVQLRGKRSNRDGLGAIVTITTSQGSQSQVQDGKSGYLSQSRMPLYFGLGTATAVESLKVQWPSGTEQVLPGPLAGNQLHVVEEE